MDELFTTGVMLIKKNYQIWFCLFYFYQYYKDKQKKVNIKSKKDKSTMIILILHGLHHLHMCFVWKI